MQYNIYYITSDKDNNNPIYIGITSNSLLRRLSGHISDSKKGQSKIHNWIKNRISEGFEIKINLIDTVEDNVFFWENFYIDLMKSWGFSLKNMLYSGYCEYNTNKKGHLSDEAKLKLSKLYTGTKKSEDSIKKSIQNRLIEADRRGFYHSIETKKKISLHHKGKIITEQERLRLKELRGNRRIKSTPLLSLEIKTNIVRYFDSIVDFINVFGGLHPNISKVLHGSRKSANGFYFCKIGSNCPIKIPLNGETPIKDNPVLK